MGKPEDDNKARDGAPLTATDGSAGPVTPEMVEHVLATVGDNCGRRIDPEGDHRYWSFSCDRYVREAQCRRFCESLNSQLTSLNVELSCEATAESKTKGQSDGQRSGRNGPSGGR